MKKSKIFLNITSFVCFVYFAFYIFTLVFIPIGIYCFIAGRSFAYKADNLDDTMKMDNNLFKKYVIFVSIFCFPFGLLSIIPYIFLTTNNISISTLKYTNVSEESNDNTNENEQLNSNEQNETYEEKIEKFKKLENFKEKGFITEEELEQAREQIFGKK